MRVTLGDGDALVHQRGRDKEQGFKGHGWEQEAVYQNQNLKTLYFMVTGNPQLMEEDWVVFGLYLATVYCMIVRKNAL